MGMGDPKYETCELTATVRSYPNLGNCHVYLRSLAVDWTRPHRLMARGDLFLSAHSWQYIQAHYLYQHDIRDGTHEPKPSNGRSGLEDSNVRHGSDK
jgi:hypothetical protein